MERDKRKKIVILTSSPFPIGLAGTNRILSYCKGFLYNGIHPVVLCFRPTESYKKVFNCSPAGNLNGIIFSYPGGTTIRVASFWGRKWNDIFALFSTFRLLLKELCKNNVLFFIFYGNHIFTELLYILLTRLFHIKIFKEESENPNIYFSGRKSLVAQLSRWFFVNKFYRYYNGVLVMTHPLRDFFLEKGISEKKILVVPQTVDYERFEVKDYNTTNSLPYDYIAYAGSLNQPKDGVFTLLESFSEISGRFSKIHLIIAGEGTQKEVKELLFLISKLKLSEKIHYIGRISSAEIPNFFCRAKLLVSCRPQSIQSDYGFPTKVVEYLACGIPVVTTTHGELVFYLEDRVNAFIANKADPNIIASKMLEVLQDYDFAMKVALKGKDLVREKFSFIKQTQKIIDFYAN